MNKVNVYRFVIEVLDFENSSTEDVIDCIKRNKYINYNRDICFNPFLQIEEKNVKLVRKFDDMRPIEVE